MATAVEGGNVHLPEQSCGDVNGRLGSGRAGGAAGLPKLTAASKLSIIKMIVVATLERRVHILKWIAVILGLVQPTQPDGYWVAPPYHRAG